VHFNIVLSAQTEFGTSFSGATALWKLKNNWDGFVHLESSNKEYFCNRYFLLSEVFSQGHPQQRAECLSEQPPQVVCISQAEDLVMRW